MRIVVTGAGGFIGSALVRRILADDSLPPGETRIDVLDIALPDFGDARVRALPGALPDERQTEALFAEPVDCLFHLAALPGGAAARDYDAGWRANFEASHALLTRLAAQRKAARLVFASSIAVFGVPLPAEVNDDTLAAPSMSYGAQKLIVETLIDDFARRGLVDGRAPRLSGIVARPRVKGGHLSGYMSDIFHAFAAGDDFVLPVSPASRSWMMSRERVVDNLIRAATLPTSAFGARRAFTLPALRVEMGELVRALAQRFGQERDLVSYEPDAAMEAQFGAYPALSTAFADSLDFHHDGDIASLIARAVNQRGASLRETRHSA